MTRSTPARVVALIGLVLQVPYLIWNVVGLKDHGLRWLTFGGTAVVVLGLVSLALAIASPALAGVSLGSRSRKAQATLLTCALGASLLSLVFSLLQAKQQSSSFRFTFWVKYLLGFSDYTFERHPGLTHASFLAWTAGTVVLLVARIVVGIKSAPSPVTPVAPNYAQTVAAPAAAPAMAPGWYPQASGGYKYWDGTSWLVASSPSSPTH